ncbi:MAG: hypothetical protein ACKV22_05575 [Bryobacteraceae bacterium]
MHPDQFADDIRTSWQSQPPVLPPLTSSLLRRTALWFVWRSRTRDILDLTFLAAQVVFFAAAAAVGEVLLCRIGCALIAAGGSYTVYQQYRRGWMRSLPSDCAATRCLPFYRSQLIRRRDMGRSFLFWGALPWAPGVVLGALGWFLSAPREWLVPAGMVAFWLGVQFMLWDGNTRAAARLQKEIDLLDEALCDPDPKAS